MNNDFELPILKKNDEEDNKVLFSKYPIEYIY